MTTVEFVALVLSAVIAAGLGFAAHRAGICTVRAVAETLHTGRAWMFAAFAKSTLWVGAATIPIVWLVPGAHGPAFAVPVAMPSLLGGFVFGIGATLNMGCAFSTLTRLAEGQIRMLLTLAGFASGVAMALRILPAAAEAAPLPPGLYGPATRGTAALATALWLFLAWEVMRLWRTRPRQAGLRGLLLASAYRLSTASLVIGLGNGVLYALHGPWAYTSVVGDLGGYAMADGSWPNTIGIVLFLALFAGMVASSVQRRGIAWEVRPRLNWLRNAFGGYLMGVGAATIPGGNDVLILHAIPGLSPHALPAYLAMIGGIAVALAAMRLSGMRPEQVDCRGDLCRTAHRRGNFTTPAFQRGCAPNRFSGNSRT